MRGFPDRAHGKWVRSVGGEERLEDGMATQSNILAWSIPWTEEPGGLQSIGLPRVGHNGNELTSTLMQIRKSISDDGTNDHNDR